MATSWSDLKIKEQTVYRPCAGYNYCLFVQMPRYWRFLMPKSQGLAACFQELSKKQKSFPAEFARHWRTRNVSALTNSWVQHQVDNITQILPEFATTTRKTFIDELRFYSNDEKELLSVAQAIANSNILQLRPRTVKKLSSAVNVDDDVEYLTAKTLSKWDVATRPTHKVILKDQCLGVENKHKVAQYLSSLDGVVFISEATKRILCHPRGQYVYNCWFRTNDLTILSFLNIIVPGTVKKVQEIRVRP